MERERRYCFACQQEAPPDAQSCPECDGTIHVLRHDDMTGQLIDNRYQVLEEIGRGGMGVVYKAKQQFIDRYVAMKVLKRDLSSDDDQIQRFLLEAKAIAALKGPHIATIHDFGATSDGRLFFTMEFCEGKSLFAILKREKKLQWKRAVRIAIQTCRSLSEAHARGIFHRDLKPENLHLSTDEMGDDFVKVLDFGIAKLASMEGAERLTRKGMVVGTPEYICPEQALDMVVDHRSDIYSLGVVLYEMLAGSPPFVAENTAALILMHVQKPPPPLVSSDEPSSIPQRLGFLVMQCLAKKPEERPQSAAMLAQELQEILDAAGTRPTEMFETSESKPAETRKAKPQAKKPETVAYDSSKAIKADRLIVLEDEVERESDRFESSSDALPPDPLAMTEAVPSAQVPVAKSAQEGEVATDPEDDEVWPPHRKVPVSGVIAGLVIVALVIVALGFWIGEGWRLGSTDPDPASDSRTEPHPGTANTPDAQVNRILDSESPVPKADASGPDGTTTAEVTAGDINTAPSDATVPAPNDVVAIPPTPDAGRADALVPQPSPDVRSSAPPLEVEEEDTGRPEEKTPKHDSPGVSNGGGAQSTEDGTGEKTAGAEKRTGKDKQDDKKDDGSSEFESLPADVEVKPEDFEPLPGTGQE